MKFGLHQLGGQFTHFYSGGWDMWDTTQIGDCPTFWGTVGKYAALTQPDAESSPDQEAERPAHEISAETAMMALHMTEYFQAQRQV